MSESHLKLREKTVVIFGPIGSLAQSIGSLLLEHGADVAFLDEKASDFQRFITSLLDMRQIHGHYGRAAVIDCVVNSQSDANDALTRAAELFGSIDIFIDVNLYDRNLEEKENSTQLMTNHVLEFLSGRGKGSLIYLLCDNDYYKFDKSKSLSKTNSALVKLIEESARKLPGKNVTTNGISVGVTDELLLKNFPDKTLQESFEHIKKELKEAKQVEPIDIAYIVAFLASTISVAINGQVVKATY